VFVSSHLLSEMAQTAQDLVVIGRGKLMYQGTTDDFVTRATTESVKVRSPHLPVLRMALSERDVTFEDLGDFLLVSEMDSDGIGELAFAAGVTLHELSPTRGSLEEAFLQLTGEAVEYHAETGE
jgi:ABC-2 type transport system ATP-binding protein